MYIKKFRFRVLPVIIILLLFTISISAIESLIEAKVSETGMDLRFKIEFNDFYFSYAIIKNTGIIDHIMMEITEATLRITQRGKMEIIDLDSGVETEEDQRGAIRKIGETKICYYRNGKIKQVGDCYFYYNNFGDLSLIGEMEIFYYSGKIRKFGEIGFIYSSGKVSKIKDLELKYFTNGKIKSVSELIFIYNDEGKISGTEGTEPGVPVTIE